MPESKMLWMGKPVEDLDKETLLKAVYFLGKENRELRADRDRWRQNGKAIEYLMAGDYYP